MTTHPRYRYIGLILAIAFSSSLISCGGGNHNSGSQAKEAELTEQNQTRLMVSTPPPRLENSLEREQLSRRLTRFNNKNKVSYIILMSDMGQVITTIAIRGKVSSVNSLLTTPDQVVNRRWTYTSGHGYSQHVVASPDLDGSYGSNGDAVFFFRASDDAYMEWNGKYLLSDAPVSLTTAPLVTIDESK